MLFFRFSLPSGFRFPLDIMLESPPSPRDILFHLLYRHKRLYFVEKTSADSKKEKQQSPPFKSYGIN